MLYEEADKSQITDLEGIEKIVRSQILELVSPEIALSYGTNNRKESRSNQESQNLGRRTKTKS
jgi:hypothetical protein